MPLLRRQPFLKQKPPSDLKPDETVFHCKLTNEIFRDYEQFFERIILCNSLVWTCSITGRPGLTYQEALETEEKARRTLASFPDTLQRPVLFLATLTHRGRFNDCLEDIYGFCKDRYFIKEVIEAEVVGETRLCRVLRVIPPNKPNAAAAADSDDDVICLDDPIPEKDTSSPEKNSDELPDAEDYEYVVQDTKKGVLCTVGANQISRKKRQFTRDKLKLYLKQHCDSAGDGVWKVRLRYIKKFKIGEARFVDFFDGPKPQFNVSEVKRVPKVKEPVADLSSGKKNKPNQKKIERDAKLEAQRAAEEQMRCQEQMRQEKAAMKEDLKQRWEEEKVRRKEERDKEREKRKEEKKKREEYMKAWNKPREDLECDDLKDLPVPSPVNIPIKRELFGDVLLVLEYLNCFSSLFDVNEQFPEGITLENLCNALAGTEINSLYVDVVKFLLSAVFTLQAEEDEEEQELEQENMSNVKLPENMDGGDLSSKDLVQAATIASHWPQLHYNTMLSQLPMDAFTLTELLRLHFLSSGASNEANIKFRYHQRGGYTSVDDAGLDLRRREPQLIAKLADKAVYDLDPAEKLKVVEALVNQLLTYVGCREFIEDNIEKLKQTRFELRNGRLAELRRERDEAAFWYKKKQEERIKDAEQEAERKAQKKKMHDERIQLIEYTKKKKVPTATLR